MSATAKRPPREVVPPNYIQRVQQTTPVFKQPDPKAQFLADVSTFQSNAAEFEVQSSQYLYDNPTAGEHEYHVHCQLLATLISDGQAILAEVNISGLTGIDTEKQFIQQKVDSYIAMMHDWHGAPGSHLDEPKAFKQAMEEAASGDVISGNL